jgi:hypothetical protein
MATAGSRVLAIYDSLVHITYLCLLPAVLPVPAFKPSCRARTAGQGYVQEDAVQSVQQGQGRVHCMARPLYGWKEGGSPKWPMQIASYNEIQRYLHQGNVGVNLYSEPSIYILTANARIIFSR